MKSTLAGRRWPYIIVPLIASLLLGIFPIPRQGALLAAEGHLALLRGDYGSAAISFEKAATLLPGRLELLTQAGTAAYDGGLYAKAAALLAKAREKSPLHEDELAMLGNAYQHTEQPDLAIDAWEEAASLGSESMALYQSLSEGYLIKGDLQKSAEALAHWKILEPENAEPAYRLGMVLAVIDPTQAHAVFLQAGQLEPGLVSKITRLEGGMAAASLEQDEAYRLTVTGQALGAVGQWLLAEAAFQRATSIRPDYSEAWALLGEARQQLGGDGGDEIHQALEINPQSILSQSLAAMRSLRRQEWQQAANYLERAAVQEPANPRWQIELGNAYTGMGKLANAYEAYSKAAELNPEDAATWRLIAAFSLSTGYEVNLAGFEAAREAVLLDAENAAGLDLLGQVYLVRGDLVSAERFLTRAVKSDGGYSPAYLHLGIVHQKQGRLEEARESYRRTIELAAGSQTGIQAKRLLDEMGSKPGSGDSPPD